MYLKEFGELTDEEKGLVKEWEKTAKSVFGRKTKEEVEEFVKDALQNHRAQKHDSDK